MVLIRSQQEAKISHYSGMLYISHHVTVRVRNLDTLDIEDYSVMNLTFNSVHVDGWCKTLLKYAGQLNTRVSALKYVT